MGVRLPKTSQNNHVSLIFGIHYLKPPKRNVRSPLPPRPNTKRDTIKNANCLSITKGPNGPLRFRHVWSPFRFKPSTGSFAGLRMNPGAIGTLGRVVPYVFLSMLNVIFQPQDDPSAPGPHNRSPNCRGSAKHQLQSPLCKTASACCRHSRRRGDVHRTGPVVGTRR